MTIDAATVLASLSCVLVFAAWLVLPHRTANAQAPTVTLPERERATTAA